MLLNVAHAIDHLVLLIFATAVGAIAADFGFARWEDLMPFAAGAFLLFGLGSVPSGRLGDHWGRRAMMLVFLFGIGASCLLAAATQNAWQLAAALTLHGRVRGDLPPGRHSDAGAEHVAAGRSDRLQRPGRQPRHRRWPRSLTGLTVKYFGWRMAFVVPGLASLAFGVLFAHVGAARGVAAVEARAAPVRPSARASSRASC